MVTGILAKNFLGTPLISRQKVLGLICVYNLSKNKPFQENDELLLSTLSNYAAIALDNTSIFVESDRTIIKTFLSRNPIGEVLEVIVKEAIQTLRADIVTLYQYDEKLDDFEIPPIIGGDFNQPDILLERGQYHKDSIIFKMLEIGKPFYAGDSNDDWFRKNIFRGNHSRKGFNEREGVISSAGIPLTSDGEKLGLIFINYRTKQLFTYEQKQLIELFANQAALAIKISRLISESDMYAKRLEVLEEVSREISSSINLNIKGILNIVYKQSERLLNVTNFYVSFYDSEKSLISFELVYENGENVDTGDGEWANREYGNGLTEKVIESGRSLIIPNNVDVWLKNNNTDSIGETAKCWMGAPMIAR